MFLEKKGKINEQKKEGERRKANKQSEKGMGRRRDREIENISIILELYL